MSVNDASAASSASVSTDGLSLVVDLSSYSLQQDPHSHSPLHALMPMVSKHPMVLHSRQPKTTNLTVFSATTNTHTSLVVLPPAYEPLTLFDVDKYDTWRDAMKAEIQVLHSNDTWSLIPFHPSMNVVGCHWVYKIKYHLNNSIKRYKTRLVA